MEENKSRSTISRPYSDLIVAMVEWSAPLTGGLTDQPTNAGDDPC
jgi:hypothetical protein